MDASALFTVTQTLLQLIDSRIVKEIESVWGFKSQLDKLKSTMSCINAVLGDAAEYEKQELGIHNHSDRDWLQKLKEAVYHAEDLLDEVDYVAQHKQLMSGNKVSKEVRLFFSRFNQPAFAFNVSREMKKIRETLDGIAKDRRDFGSQLRLPADRRMSTRTKMRDLRSLVHGSDIVGRDEEKRVVLDMLLDTNVQYYIRFVTIVGVGGLGKTTLAKLIFDDDSIQREFPFKFRVCVSEDFDLRSIITEFLKSTRKDEAMQELESQFRAKIRGQKYLIILDDLWNEDRNTWLQLKELLSGGAEGSRVVVTTRSKVVAEIVGDSSSHIELTGLSPQDSWSLFKRMAFQNEHQVLDDEFTEIGEHIVKKCSNVPLVIRVVGSFLYGQHISMWKSFRDMDLGSIDQNNSSVMPILKLSYYHLDPHLRRCFAFCALFPKDRKIDKTELINLWMANSFIQPLQGQSLEDAGDQYFTALLQRCFFQEVALDDLSGDIKSCKMHDLMHDVAQEVAKTDVLVVSSARCSSDKNIRHLFVNGSYGDEAVGSLANKLERMHTILLPYGSLKWTPIRTILSEAIYLRALGCRFAYNINRPPNTINKLTQLRFLNLSYSWELKCLPTSFVNLYNLQTLLLRDCRYLKELPRNFKKLVNLRHLDLDGCDNLTHMPPFWMNEMTRLQTLTLFVAGGRSNWSCSMGSHVVQLEDLAAFTNLKGSLEIRVHDFNATRAKAAGYILRSKEHIKKVAIRWAFERTPTDDGVSLLESVQPHPNLRSFLVKNYPGEALVRWASSEKFVASLPNLVRLEIRNCKRLKELPLLSQLHHLRFLCISNLGALEYVENSSGYDDGTSAPSSTSSSKSMSEATNYSQIQFFPSLENLELNSLSELKGWWKTISGVEHQQRRSLLLPSFAFPRLSKLQVWGCPNLTAIPLPPTLEELILYDTFSPSVLSVNSSTDAATATSGDSSHPSWKLKSVEIDKVEFLICLPRKCFQYLSKLRIVAYDGISLSMLEEMFRSCLSSSLRSLDISYCDRLKGVVGGGLEHLTCLERLELYDLREVEEMEDMNEMPWKSLHRNLRHLLFSNLPKLVNLPRGIKYLTSLQSLGISQCEQLEALPQEMTCLTSLQSLDIVYCPLLKERCKEPTGEDWPKIKHIPKLTQVEERNCSN